MKAKFSAGKYWLRFSQETGGNLPAPAENLREASTVRTRVDFFHSEKRLPLFNTKQLDQSCNFLPLKSMINPSKIILFQKCWTFGIQ